MRKGKKKPEALPIVVGSGKSSDLAIQRVAVLGSGWSAYS
jgi:hypothetical protein